MQQVQDYQASRGGQGYLRTGQAQAEAGIGEQKFFGLYQGDKKFEARNQKFETNANDQNSK
jgi:hypothetical protein